MQSCQDARSLLSSSPKVPVSCLFPLARRHRLLDERIGAGREFKAFVSAIVGHVRCFREVREAAVCHSLGLPPVVRTQVT